MIKFYSTRGEYGFLSNFYKCNIFYDGKWWVSSERVYQSRKTHCQNWQEKIRNAGSIFDAVVIGRCNDLPIREDWEDVKIDIMYDCLLLKFSQNVDLRNKLLETGATIIVEDSPKDYYWGIGRDGSGLNNLGKLLMLVRDQFLEDK